MALLLLCLFARPSLAWVETEIRGHRATVVVASDGSAEVRHELLLRVRGGPLESLEIEGVGAQVQVLGDGTVQSTASGAAQRWPLELDVREDGLLLVRLGTERGLRAGVYQFEFGYRFDLLERGWLERKGDKARVTWAQPRFSVGIDSAKVLLRVPPTELGPSLPAEDGPASSVLLSEVRRGSQFDDVELVRAHVAKGEPAVWQVELSAAAFPTLGAHEPASAEDLKTSRRASGPLIVPSTPFWTWIVGAFVGFLYAFLVRYKAKSVQRNCQTAGVRGRALVPLPPLARALTSGLMLGAAAVLALAEWPTAAGASLALALLFTTLLPPHREVRARGPGEWVRLTEGELTRSKKRIVAGAWLDASQLRGAGTLVVIIFVTVAAAAALLPKSPYYAGLVLASLAAWLPVFLTGRMSDMPADAAWGAFPLYRWLEKKLGKQDDVTVEYWGRRPLPLGERRSDMGDGAPPATHEELSLYDEIRLRVTAPHLVRGLRALEVGVEIGGGLLAMPCVVVRVDDDSVAYRALPRSVHFVRGRRSGERVALLRPRVPSRGLCLQLLVGTLRLMRGSPHSRSPGSGVETSSAPARAHRGPGVLRADLELPTV